MLAENPDTIMEILEDYQTSKEEEEEVKVDVDGESYKAAIEYAKNNVKIGVKIFRVGEQDLFCVDFTRKDGDLIDFLSSFKEIEDHINKRFGYLDQGEEEE